MEALITIVGFLGAGKTTLLKHVTNSYLDKGWSPFIILNDYENANIDALQFTDKIAKKWIQPLTGSCICCSGIHELRNYVNRIPERMNGITLIEANGTSDACALMEFLGVGLNERFLPPVQLAVVDVKNWQKRGEHNELELNQVQVSSLIILTHKEKVSEDRKKEVVLNLKQTNSFAKIITMEDLDSTILPNLFPSKNSIQKLEHQKAHWASCSIGLPVLPDEKSIHHICNALPKSILRVKGCARIGEDTAYTFFERIPNGEVFIRPFNGIPTTGSKLLTIGPGSEPFLLRKTLKNILYNNPK